MGVHYFYTWITRRYPLIRKRYDSQLMPGIDNFYIDLNGVLYRCAKDQGAIFRDILKGKGFDEIFRAVVNYINYIVNHVKPNKRLFIAIDGVAPRAKMNNQRQRRYHSAKNNKDMNEFLESTLKTSSGVISFKNNSISPGTEFMMTLIEHLKFFIQRKIQEDENWRKIEVILSGGDVPGEGEHKIMDWIRAWKQGPDYSINESHCIYGNDSDLVFLCLCLHLPNMVILREEMNWDRRKVNTATKREPSKEHMELLFINILREYMYLEYKDLDFKHEFDIERVIDDFTLLSFFIGNDFLHKLYCMNTKKGNFDEIIKNFKNVLPKLDGYVSEKGKVNWKRFLQILKKITHMENKMIHTTMGDMEHFLSDLEKSSYSYVIMDQDNEEEEIRENEAKDQTEGTQAKQDPQGNADEADFVDVDDSEQLAQVIHEALNLDDDKYEGEKKSINEKNHELEYKVYYNKIKEEVKYISALISTLKNGTEEEIMQQKANFYKKFFNVNDIGKLKNICREYLKGVQFVMYYYFRGCPSWEWYYPYFMSPMLSDLIVILDSLLDENANLEFSFAATEPYKPFNQLMFILPKASLGLLPPAYGEHILKEGSPILKFYPEEYDFAPFDGIKEYLWIAQIEVIDKAMIDKYMEGFDYSALSDKDKYRNRRGEDLRYTYDPEAKEATPVKSTLSGIPDFEVKIKIEEFNIRTQYEFNWENISLSLDGFKPNSFPSLFIAKNVSAKIERISRRAKYDKLVVTIKPDPELKKKKIYKPYSGKVYYDYPFKLEGSVNTIIGRNNTSTIGSLDSKKTNDVISQSRSKNAQSIYYNVSTDVSKYHYFQKGIDLKIDEGKEYFYELERAKSSWRTIEPSRGGHYNQIIHEFDNVSELHPHSLVFESKEGSNLINICNKESEMLKMDGSAVALTNGELLEPVDYSNLMVGKFKIKKQNYVGTKPAFNSQELMEDDWHFVNKQFLEDIGLKPGQATILWFILDSFVIRTDSSKTSSIILGDLFDIGLKFMDCLSRFRSIHDLRVVTDMIKIMRARNHTDFTLQIRKRNDYIPHNVFLTSRAKKMVKEYIEAFPEVAKYIASNIHKFKNPKKIPKDHDVKAIFKLGKNGDPNIKLFNIYTWIMQNDTNTLKLSSALCLNASSQKVEKLVEKVDSLVEKYKAKKSRIGQPVTLDKNLVMHDNQYQLPVGTTFNQHPSYPNIGDRVVITSNQHKHVSFGMTGTVIGTYKLKIEVLFDEPFIGGTSLSGRCPSFRGAIVDFFDIFDLSNWVFYINKRKVLEQKGRYGHFEEWNGRVDMMNLIGKMNQYRRLYEDKSFRSGKRGGNRGNNQGNQGYKGRGKHPKSKLKKTSSEFKSGSSYRPKRQAQTSDQIQLQNDLLNDLGMGNSNPIPTNNSNNRIGNYQGEESEEFQQTFYVTDGGRVPNNRRNNHMNKKRPRNGKRRNDNEKR